MISTMYAPGLGALQLAPIASQVQRSRLPVLTKLNFGVSSSATGTSNLMLVGAVAGVGLLAYLAAKALKK